MPTITVALEGPDADRALAELLALPGVEGERRPTAGEDERDGGTLVAIGAIVGIVSGVAQLVSSIIDWRGRWISAREGRRLSVVVEDAGGRRLLLNDASPEQIAAVLKTLPPRAGG